MDYKHESVTSNNMDNSKDLTIIQKIPKQHTGKAQKKETTENRQIWFLRTNVGR